MNLEIVVAILFFIAALLLLFRNKQYALVVLLVLSVFLHKEFFSIYTWDVLPVRVFMAAFSLFIGIRLVLFLFQKGSIRRIFSYLKDPFLLLITALWVVDGVSILNSQNIRQSILIYGFFTSVYLVVIYLYTAFFVEAAAVLKYVKIYIFLMFALCMFAVVQFGVYLKTGFIFGALWNVPGHLPRLGATFWDINHFAGLLAALIPVVATLALISKTVKLRAVYAFATVSMAGILILTNSRSAWILVSVAFISFVLVVLLRRLGQRGFLYVAVTIFLLAIPLMREYSTKSSPFRAYVKQYFHYRVDSFDSHLLLLRGAFQVFEKYPLLGGGYGSFFEQFSKTDVASEFFSRDPAGLNVRTPAHSIWGEAFAETGFLGISAFALLAILLVSIPLTAALTLEDKDKYMMSAAMFSALLGWYTAGIFQSYKSEFFWIVLLLYFMYPALLLGRDTYFNSLVQYLAKFSRLPFYILALLAFFLLFYGLGSNHLIPWDEAIYAEIAKNMLTGSRVVQEWISETPWFEKPPLYMWLQAVSMSVFGANEFAARFPSAVFGFLTVIGVYFLGKKMFGTLVGFISAFSLLTTFQFLYYSRTAMLDVTLTFFITTCLYCYLLARESKHMRYWILCGVLGGFAVMTKSAAGLLAFPIIILYDFYLILVGDLKPSRALLKNYAYVLVPFLVVVMPWHLEMVRRFGTTFLSNYLGYHILARAISDIEEKAKPLLWYLIVLKVSMRSWFVVLFAAFPLSLFLTAVRKNRQHAFLVIWAVFIFLFFSAARSKLVWYILPVYPPLAIMIGFLAGFLLNFVMYKFPRFFDRPTFKVGAVFVVVMLELLYLFLNRGLVYTIDLTGPEALLLKEKDAKFGVEKKVYADRIDRPLVIFYSDGPYEIVDFGPLKERLDFAAYSEEVIFITKESRFRKFNETQPNLELVDRQKEWVLGRLNSGLNADLKRLEIAGILRERAQKDINNASSEGREVTPEMLAELQRRQAEERGVAAEIQAKEKL